MNEGGNQDFNHIFYYKLGNNESIQSFVFLVSLGFHKLKITLGQSLL